MMSNKCALSTLNPMKDTRGMRVKARKCSVDSLAQVRDTVHCHGYSSPGCFDTFLLSHGLAWGMLQSPLDTYNRLMKPSCQPVGRKWEQSKDQILGIVLCAATDGFGKGFDLVNQGMIDNGQYKLTFTLISVVFVLSLLTVPQAISI